MTLPALSVVVPLFNKSPHVAAALRSVLDLEGVNLEVVMVGDGSTSPTTEFVANTTRRLQRANAALAVSAYHDLVMKRRMGP